MAETANKTDLAGSSSEDNSAINAPKSFSSEEILQILNEKVAPPRPALKMFGKEACGELVRIAHNQLLLEADEMFANKLLPFEQLVDYMAQLPEMVALETELSQAVFATAHHLVETGQMDSVARRSFDKNGELVHYEQNPFISILERLQLLVRSQMVKFPSVRNALLHRYEVNVIGLIAYGVIVRASADEAPGIEKLIELMIAADRRDPDGIGSSYVFYKIYDVTTKLLKRCPKGAEDIVATTNERAIDDIVSENELMAKRLADISYFRKAESREYDFGEQSITLLGERSQEADKDFKLYYSCSFRICLDPFLEGNNGTLDVSVSMSTGELYLTGTLIPCVHFLPNKEQYDRLRNVVLNLAVEFFESKEDDIIDTTLFTPQERRDVSVAYELEHQDNNNNDDLGEKSVDVEELGGQGDEDEASHKARLEAQRLVEEAKKVATDYHNSKREFAARKRLERQQRAAEEKRVDIEARLVEQEKANVKARQRLSRVSVERICGALETISKSGDRITLARITGHAVYKNIETGVSYPLPPTSRKPIPIDWLKDIQRILGISAVELEKKL